MYFKISKNFKKLRRASLYFLLALFVVGCSNEEPPEPEPEPLGDFVVVFYNQLGGSGVSNEFLTVRVPKGGDGRLEKPSSQPTRKGYNFINWQTSRQQTFDFLTDRIIQDFVLYAKWEKIKRKVAFDTQGGNDIDPILIPDGDILELPPDPERANHVFDGWYFDINYTQVFDTFLPIIRETILYAKWKVKTYDVVFFSNGGSFVEHQRVVSGTGVEQPTNPSRENFVFDGWYFGLEDNASLFDFYNTKIIRRTVLYGKWTEKKVKVVYEANGGIFGADDGGGSKFEYEIKGGTRAVFRRPSRLGYDFDSWYTDLAFTKEFSFSSFISSDIVLYAKWDVKRYDIRFVDPNGGALAEIQRVEINDTATKPADPESGSNTTFLGWYDSLDYRDEYDFDSPITGDKVLYAYFAIYRNVEFNLNGGEINPPEATKQRVVTGRKLKTPPEPTRDGYSFNGWKYQEKYYDFSSTVDKDMVLTAEWLSSEAVIISMNITQLDNPGLPNSSYTAIPQGRKIRLTIPNANLTNIKPQFVTTGVHGDDPLLDSAQNFSNGPIKYKLEAQDNSIVEYEVEISNTASSENLINVYEFRVTGVNALKLDATVSAKIDHNTNEILVELPNGVTPDGLRPSISTSINSTVKPISGTSINQYDPTSPITYTVTAEDKSTKTYRLIISNAKKTDKTISAFTFDADKNKDDEGQSYINGTPTTTISGTDINVTLPVGSVSSNLRPTIVASAYSIDPSPDSLQDFTSVVNYTVRAEDNTKEEYTVTVTVIKSTNNKILEFNLLEKDNSLLTEDYIGVIDNTSNTITIRIPETVDLSSTLLAPTIVPQEYTQYSPTLSRQSFTNPVKYTVSSQTPNNDREYTVTVINDLPSSVKEIDAFSFDKKSNPSLKKSYGSTILSNNIYVDVPYDTDLTSLKPTIGLKGRNINPSPSQAQDFSDATNLVTYTVTAKDGSKKVYSVIVQVAPNQAKQITSFVLTKSKNPSLTQDVIGQITGTEILLELPAGEPLSNLTPDIVHNGKDVLPRSGQTLDFNTPKTYIVEGFDGNDQNYTVQAINYPSETKEIKEFGFLRSNNPALQSDFLGTLNPSSFSITIDDFPPSLLQNLLRPTFSFKGKRVTPSEGDSVNFSSGTADFTVDAYDGSSRIYTVIINTRKDSTKEIVSFGFLNKANNALSIDVAGIVDQDTNTIEVDMPYGTNISNLLPEVNVKGAFYEPLGPQNFQDSATNSVIYIVSAEDGTRRQYTVKLNYKKNSEAKITGFLFSSNDNQKLTANALGVINGLNITINFPSGTDVSNLSPQIIYSPGASIEPVAPASRNFNTPVSYTVTSQDLSNQSIYRVTAEISASASKDILNFTFNPSDNINNIKEPVTANIEGTNITVTLPYGTDITNLFPRIQISGDSYTPAREVDFSDSSGNPRPVTYSVIAKDGTEKEYQVSITIASRKSYEVSLDKNDGSTNAVMNIDVLDGGSLPSNTRPTRIGYTFGGWYTSTGSFNDPNSRVSYDTPIVSDMTLYAKWIIITRTVTFIDGENTIFTEQIDYFEQLEKPSPDPTKENEIFVGWYINQELNNAYEDFGKTISSSFDLYAKFSKSFFTVTYFSLGQSYSQQIPQGLPYKDITIPSEVTKLGNSIEGFYEDVLFTQKFDTDNETVQGDKTLYVKWVSDANEIIEVSFTSPLQPSGEEPIQAIVLASSFEVALSINAEYLSQPLVPSYTLSSDSTISPLGEINLSNTDTKVVTVTSQSGKEQTYTIVVTPKYLVTYKYDHPTDPDYADLIKRVKKGTFAPITSPDVFIPSIDGYNFLGWYKDVAVTEAYDTTKDENHITQSTSLYGKWNKDIYTVTFNTDGGSEITEQTVEHGQLIDASSVTPVRNDGYIFVGWQDSRGNDFDVENTTIVADIELVAIWSKTVKVTFHLNGGRLATDFNDSNQVQVRNPQIIPKGGKIQKPIGEPNKDNYTFFGWIEGISDDAPFNFDSQVVNPSSNEMSLFAKYRSKEAKITAFKLETTENTNIGIDDIIGTIDEDKKEIGIKFPPTAIVSGLKPTINISSGATIALNTEGPVDFSLNGSVKYTVTAEDGETKSTYTVYLMHTVRFDLDGGTSGPDIQEIEVRSGHNILGSNIPTPTKPNLLFVEWRDANKVKVDFQNKTINQNLDVKAYYGYSVTFEVLEGKGGPNPKIIKVVSGETLLDNITPPTKVGHTFVGWYSDKDLTPPAFDFDTPIGSDIRLYARYKIDKYEVIFELEDGSHGGSEAPLTEIVEYNQQPLLFSISPDRVGYTFVGWYNRATNGEQILKPPAITEPTRLYARYKIKEYKVTFDLQGGSYNNSTDNPTQEIPYNSSATALASPPTKDGYDFDKWYSDQALTNEFDFANTKIIKDITLYAKYNKNGVVSFDLQGGSYNNSTDTPTQEIPYNSSATALSPVPEKLEHTFEDWYSDQALTNKFDFNTLITSNVTLYAKWTQNSYTITFNTYGGTATANEIVLGGEKLTEPTAPTKLGHTFVDWYSDSGFTTDFDFDTLIGSDMTLYANYKIEEYEVTFDLNGGKIEGGGGAIPTQEIPYNKFATALSPVPEKLGHTFEGWYSDQTLKIVFVFANTEIIKDITLYARYKIKEYRVTFDLNGGKIEGGGGANPTQEVEYNSNAMALNPSPTRDKYTFIHWYKDRADADQEVSYDFNQPVVANITLKALWKHRVTYLANRGVFSTFGGTRTSATNDFLDIQDVAELPQRPIREGYRFIHWYNKDATDATDAPATIPFVFGSTISDNMTLMAAWGWQITWNLNGGTSPPYQNYVIENTLISDPSSTNNPTRQDFTFAHWEDVSTNKPYDFNNPPTSDIFLKAVWNVEVEFFKTDGKTSIKKVTVLENSILESDKFPDLVDPDDNLYDPNNPSYDFLGWYDVDANTGGNRFEAGRSIAVKGLKLYPRWRKLHIVTFDYNSTQSDTTEKVRDGELISNLPTPSDGILDYWATSENENTPYEKNTPITANITLKAKYLSLENPIVFHDSNFGSAINSADATVAERLSDNSGWKVVVANVLNLESFTGPSGNLYINDVREFKYYKDLKHIKLTNTRVSKIDLSHSNEITTVDFSYNKDLKTIDLSGTKITHLPAKAFKECDSLTTVILPPNLETIGNEAFMGCKALKTIKFPSSLTAIGDDAFWGCGKLETVDASDTKLKSIGKSAFFRNITLDTISLPSTLEDIKESAFEGCSALTEIRLSFSLKTLGNKAFKGCTALNSADMSQVNVLETIGQSCFESSGITAVTIPKSVTSIGVKAFYDCKALKTVEIRADKLENLLEKTFAALNTSVLKSVDMSSAIGLKEIGAPLTTTTTTTTPISNGSRVFNGIGKDNIEGTTVILPPNLETIGKEAFMEAKLKSIDISGLAKLTTINEKAFSNVTTVAGYDFEIRDTPELKTIGKFAFTGSQIKFFQVPQKLETLTNQSFYQCKHLEEVDFSYALALKTIGKSNFSESTALVRLTQFSTAPKLQTIKENAFRENALTSIILPPALKTIGIRAFLQITDSITKIDMSRATKLTTVADYAFRGIYSTRSIEIIFPALENTLTLGYAVFRNLNIASIKILAPVAASAMVVIEENTFLDTNLDEPKSGEGSSVRVDYPDGTKYTSITNWTNLNANFRSF